MSPEWRPSRPHRRHRARRARRPLRREVNPRTRAGSAARARPGPPAGTRRGCAREEWCDASGAVGVTTRPVRHDGRGRRTVRSGPSAWKRRTSSLSSPRMPRTSIAVRDEHALRAQDVRPVEPDVGHGGQALEVEPTACLRIGSRRNGTGTTSRRRRSRADDRGPSGRPRGAPPPPASGRRRESNRARALRGRRGVCGARPGATAATAQTPPDGRVVPDAERSSDATMAASGSGAASGAVTSRQRRHRLVPRSGHLFQHRRRVQ